MRHWHPDSPTAMPRTWQEAADTREEHAAMTIDMDRSRDEINDRKEDSNDA